MQQPTFWSKAKVALAKRDPVMGALLHAFPRVSLVGRGDPFLTLARSIVGQQISVKAAASIWSRIEGLAPQICPERIAPVALQDLRECGLSVRKAEYVRELAEGFLSGRLRVAEWQELNDDAVIADLVQIRGIGRWTAEMFLMFNLMRPDILPLDDRGLQNAISHYYLLGAPFQRQSAIELAEAWRPWRSVATWYLWRSLEPVPGDY